MSPTVSFPMSNNLILFHKFKHIPMWLPHLEHLALNLFPRSMYSEEQNALIIPKLVMLYHCTSCERSSILSLTFMKWLLEVSLLQTVLPTVPNFSSTNTFIRNYFGLFQAIARVFLPLPPSSPFFAATSHSKPTTTSPFFVAMSLEAHYHLTLFCSDITLDAWHYHFTLFCCDFTLDTRYHLTLAHSTHEEHFVYTISWCLLSP